MEIKILGTGCPKCKIQEENVKKAIHELDLENVVIEHVTQIDKIIDYGVMSTPAVVVEDEVMGFGKVFSVDEVKDWLR